MITITEILGRSEQGMTRPFLCRGDDDQLYYVKGKYAGQRSLCCEWVAGRLARLLGLPLPEFTMCEVPMSLVTGSDRPDIRDLGAGIAFGSLRLEGAREITWEEATNWRPEMTAMVLLFDLWVQNEDRSLSALGGNPNLLVTAENLGDEGRPHVLQSLWIYDFNLSFDEGFDRELFWMGHIFGELLSEWPAGLIDEMVPHMRDALARLPEIFSELPLEWLHVDGDESLPVQFDQDHVYKTLHLPFAQPDAFWTMP